MAQQTILGWLEAAMTSYQIRRATTQDITALVDFNRRLAWETEDRELDLEVLTQGVTRAFAQGDEALYFVADHESSCVGSLMLTREWSDWRDGWLVWIQSVYVLPEHRTKGVFKALLHRATTHVEDDPDCIGLRLYVENKNDRAQAVYARSGFVDPSYRVLEKILPQQGD